MAKKTSDLTYFESVGRRKEAVARVRLYKAKGKDKTVTLPGLVMKQGEIYVNKKPITEIFPLPFHKVRYLKPLKIAGAEGAYAISILVAGGGSNGQLDAVVNGLAKALEKTDTENLRTLLKKEGLLTRDSRIRERRKVGTGGRARRQKQSPKR